MKKNIALIGAGHWGKNHLRNLAQQGILNTVLEKSDEIIRERKKDFPGVLFVKEDRQVMDNENVQGVVIAAPAELHYELAKKYLLAGKDVLVEKPMALTAADGEDLIKIAGKKGRILMVGHILQYHPAVIKLKELIDKGELGQIRYIYSNRLNIGKLRVEENVLWSFAPHDISLILMFLKGEEPERVDAHGGAYVNPGIYDTTLTTLEFKNGVKSHIFVNWLHPFKEQKLVVVGSEKMAVFNGLGDPGNTLLIYPHTIDFTAGDIPVARKAESYPVTFAGKEPLREELLHFVDCIERRKTPRTDGVEGLAVLRVLEQAEKKLKGEG